MQFTYSPVDEAPWATNPDVNAVYGPFLKAGFYTLDISPLEVKTKLGINA